MVPNKISFTGLDIENPYDVLLAQQQNKPSFWPLSWTPILEPVDKNGKDGLEGVNVFQWFKLNCCHQWDMEIDATGRRIFAFEDEGEATLFMLRF